MMIALKIWTQPRNRQNEHKHSNPNPYTETNKDDLNIQNQALWKFPDTPNITVEDNEEEDPYRLRPNHHSQYIIYIYKQYEPI